MNFQDALHHSNLIFSETIDTIDGGDNETEMMRDLQRLKGLRNLVIPMGVAMPMIASLNGAEAAARYYYYRAENHTLTI